ncbi:DUF6697 family protein [Lamprobacter modestohalophilus]|uniref:DUF6697 family protein n=1 Tax=Chromatiaceae TaxID=1046 RepID=UPI0019145D3B|nr:MULTISPECIES: DUF6697 family protein [Chromatiaceae]MEA1053338.1 DUF6697 family protein [Lamprobacter modestohalophilus]
MANSFERHKRYTRSDIHAVVGGSVQAYLPTMAKVVVAACLNPAQNPQAPEVVLVGCGPRIEATAAQFLRQGSAVPTFVKHQANAWEFVGDYRAVRQSFDLDEIERHAKTAGRDGDVTSILFLEPVV